MLGRSVTTALAVTALSLFTTHASAQTLDPIVISGSKFFYKSNGTEL